MDAPRRFPFIPRTNLRFWLPVIVAALTSLSVAAQGPNSDNPRRPDDLTPAEEAEPPPPEEGWQESLIELPPFPRAQDLIPFRADMGDADYTYYIDVNSVFLAADEVLRYTVIIQSPAGGSNIVYEGIRCATDEIKTFAYGTKNGRFERMADPKWIYVHTGGVMGYRTSLVEIYVCDDETGWAMDSDAVLERLVLYDPRRPRFIPRKERESSRE